MVYSTEEALIGSVLDVSLVPVEDSSVHVLSSLAEELRKEAESNEKALVLTKEIIDRVLVARLMDEPPAQGQLNPLQYLLACYSRLYQATREMNSAQGANKTSQTKLQETLVELRNLILSYAGLIFTPGVVPRTGQVELLGLQLLESIEAVESPKDGITPMPSLFLEEFSNSQDISVLQCALKPIVIEFQRRLAIVTLAAEYHQPLRLLTALIQVPKMAAALVQLPEFLGKCDNGRRFETVTLLGAFFSIGPVPDRMRRQGPNIGEQFFPDHENTSRRDQYESVISLSKTSLQYVDDLHAVVRTLLKKETRKEMMEWFTKAIALNQARAQLNPPRQQISSDSFCFNVCSVLVQLCDPFVDPLSNKSWPHLNSDYILSNDRLDFSEDTSFTLSPNEIQSLKEDLQKKEKKENPHFICECFFMTLKALHIGSVKTMSEMQYVAREIHRLEDEIKNLEQVVSREQNSAQKARAEFELKKYKVGLENLYQLQLCTEAAICSPNYLTKMNTFYRLVVAWMMRLTSINSKDSFQIPLPDPPPTQFAALPEFFIEDVVDTLICTGRAAPQVLGSVDLEDTVIFLMAMMGSPAYVKNPYLRGKLADVLHACLPRTLRQHPLTRGRPDILAFVFEKHPVILALLVPSLLQLFVDIEFTGRHAQFHEKFEIRSTISDLLEYLWKIDEHNKAWKLVAAKEQGRGLYLLFCNMLVNDSIYVLDDSLKQLQEIKELETLMANQEEWNTLSREEQQERERDLSQHGLHLKGMLYRAKRYIRFLQTVTKETQTTFLLAEMVERVAAMLNYFLKYLTGSERKQLKIKNPEEYDFDPKELLTGILEVYLFLDSADSDGVFATAISVDGRSYRNEMFEEALAVVEKMALMLPDKIISIRKLSKKCKDAAIKNAQEEEVLGEIPDEFLDPIQCTLMKDPVILPTSGNTLDRATITRHLLSDPKDPFNRKPLTSDMLLPNLELKKEIDEWLAKQKASMS